MNTELMSLAGPAFLSGGISSGSTTLAIVSGVNWPTDLSGSFRVLIDKEIIRLQGAVSGSFIYNIVEQGAEGTIAATHWDHATIINPITPQGVKNLIGGVNNQFGNNYTIGANDNRALIVAFVSGAYTLPQATSGDITSYGPHFVTNIINLASGSTVTVTSTVSQINSGLSLVLATNQFTTIWSDGINYWATVPASGGGFSLTSGIITSGYIGNNAVLSGNIGSGQIASGHLASGLLANITVNSGSIGSGLIASGAVNGFFGTTRNINSGTVGVFDLGSGAVIAGTVGSGAIQSGNLSSGLIGDYALASGAGITAARYLEVFKSGFAGVTEEIISGVRAVCISQSGNIRIAKASISGLMPAIGVVYDNVLSGIQPNVYTQGILQYSSGLGDYSGNLGRPLYVGRSGHVVTASGSWNSGGFADTDQIQFIGTVYNSGASLINVSLPYATDPNAISFKQDCQAATTTTLAAYTYNNGVGGVGATITLTVAAVLVLDGYTPNLNDRILIKNETGGNAPFNGLYKFTTVGTVIVNAVLTRTSDFDESTDGINGSRVYIQNGTLNGNNTWYCATFGSITFGTTNISFSKYAAGANLTSGQVTSGYLGDASVVSGSVASGAIGFPHLANASVQSGTIASGAIANNHFAATATVPIATTLVPLGVYSGTAPISYTANAGQTLSTANLCFINASGVVLTTTGNPPIGAAATAVSSGRPVSIITVGFISTNLYSGFVGQPLFAGNGSTPVLSGAGFGLRQCVGTVLNSGIMWNFNNPQIPILSGDVTSGLIGAGAVISGNIASGLLVTLFGELHGLVTSYTSGSAAGTSGSIVIGKGICSDTSGVIYLPFASGITKTIASGTTWKSGGGNAGLDAVYPLASLRSGWLHLYAISDGNITDAILCNSVSGLTPLSLPGGMVYSRRIMSLRTDASGNVEPYHQYGDSVIMDQPQADVNTTALISGTTIFTITTPPGVVTQALLNVAYTNQVGAATVYLTSINQDAAIGVGAAIGAITYRNPAVGQFAAGPAAVFTDTSGRIRVQNNFQSGQLFIGTQGWVDTRGKDG